MYAIVIETPTLFSRTFLWSSRKVSNRISKELYRFYKCNRLGMSRSCSDISSGKKRNYDMLSSLILRHCQHVAEWLRRLTRKPRVRTAVGSNPTLDSLVAVRNSSPGQPEPCEGNLVAAAGSCGGLMVKHPWPLLKISLSDFRRLATLNKYLHLPT